MSASSDMPSDVKEILPSPMRWNASMMICAAQLRTFWEAAYLTMHGSRQHLVSRQEGLDFENPA
eukprot:6658006-Karenia_brevis.AAC.1